MGAIGQDVDDVNGSRGGIGRRIGRRIISAAEDVALTHAEQAAVARMQAKPAYNRAARLARDAERDLSMALEEYGQACADLILGVGEEAAVEEAERAVEALQREQRRMEAAAAVLGEDLGVIRDSSGVKLSR